MYLHLVALNIPYPANYGGVIDIFYKIKALHAEGVRIILHTFLYERDAAPELEELCEKVYYYKRATGVIPNLSYLPYNVYSRKSPELLHNLLADNYPILFEGLHTCYYLNHKELRNRIKIVRPCNIEHTYYYHLAKAEQNLLRKGFFLVEALRLRLYQRQLRYADWVIAVSDTERSYLQTYLPEKRVDFIPCFHENEAITAKAGSSNFILYHGKLSVLENERAALYLIKNLFGHLPYRSVIAGMNPSARLLRAASQYANVEVIANPSEEAMHRLQEEAQVHLLVTFQGTGLKLKLLNSLYMGRHVVVNPAMLEGSGLNALCHIAETPHAMLQVVERLMHTPFSAATLAERSELLSAHFSNREGALRIVHFLRGLY